MKTFWIKAASSAIALLFVGGVNAAVIDFENLDTTFAPFAPLLADGDAVVQGNYFVNTQDAFAGGGLIAQLSSGADPSSCLNGVCPTGNSTNFLSVFNDGLAHIGRLDGLGTVFGSIGAAYIPTPGSAAGSTVFLVIEADRLDGSFVDFFFPLLSSGAFQTITSATAGTRLAGSGTLTSGVVTDLFVFSLFCNGATGSCTDFTTNRGQFAIDNVVLDAVTATLPEPSEGILGLTGLALVAALSRRRRAV
jgi:MYXO-CTERM domain-containing protein